MFGIYEKTYNILIRYFETKKSIQKVIIYGSRAMEKERPGSDIDFAIFSNACHDMTGEIKTELEELPTPYLYDVTDMNYLSYLPLEEHITRVGKIFFKR